MIHVAYRLWGGDGFYAKMTGTSMLSMFENTKEEVTVHIMHNDRLTDDNRDKFYYIAGQYNQQVEFHNVEEIAGSTLRKFEAAYPNDSKTNSAWYPLIVHEVFPDFDKIIFLGADTVFNLDISELWDYDPNENGCGFGAVPELKTPKTLLPLCNDGLVKYENYFNSDVMIINPKFFRENFETILDACKFIYEKNYSYGEQDTLNYLFSEKYLKLPYHFNEILRDIRSFDPKPHRLEKAIYHYADAKPDLDTDDVFNKLYFKYFLKTPWATANMFGNINKAMEKKIYEAVNNSRKMMLNVTNLLSERHRAFFVDEDLIEEAKQIFKIKDHELVMNSSTDAKNFLQKLNDSKGKILLFVLSDDYWKIRSFLLSKNFVEDTDFVNGALFLSERHGVKFNFSTREIVQAI